MNVTFRLNANELDAKFLEAIKELFAGQNIVIRVLEEPDGTDYLLSDTERKEGLPKSYERAVDGEISSTTR